MSSRQGWGAGSSRGRARGAGRLCVCEILPFPLSLRSSFANTTLAPSCAHRVSERRLCLGQRGHWLGDKCRGAAWHLMAGVGWAVKTRDGGQMWDLQPLCDLGAEGKPASVGRDSLTACRALDRQPRPPAASQPDPGAPAPSGRPVCSPPARWEPDAPGTGRHHPKGCGVLLQVCGHRPQPLPWPSSVCRREAVMAAQGKASKGLVKLG